MAFRGLSRNIIRLFKANQAEDVRLVQVWPESWPGAAVDQQGFVSWEFGEK